MNRVRVLFGGRNVFVVMALAFVAVAFFFATVPTAEAIIGPSLCTYYKDATYKKVVGSRGTGCCGETISWGVTSAYKKCQTLLCPDVVCPD